MWENRVKRFVSREYDDEMVAVFENAISWGGVVIAGMSEQSHSDAMQRGIEFLEGLKLEPVPEKLPGILGKLQQAEKEQVKQQPRVQSVQHFNISGGTVHAGNGNIEQNITVRDIITQLSDEIEKLPDSQEKKSVLQALTSITTNETFASISGAFIGTLLGRIINPTGH